MRRGKEERHTLHTALFINHCMELFINKLAPHALLCRFQPEAGVREAGPGEDRDPAAVHHGEEELKMHAQISSVANCWTFLHGYVA